ncbi:MAG: TetR/AcrR family transcriptional regulator [Pseudomonadota bacterium]
MGRTKQYDQARARAGFLATFLRKGYAEASLADLEAGSGLNRRQIYNDFGDKRALLLQAIQDFRSSVVDPILHDLERSDLGVDAIRSTLTRMVDGADTEHGRLGCLMCNTSREPIAQDADVGAQIDVFFRRVEGAYRKAIKRAVERGELPDNTSVRSLGRFFLGVHVSLCVLGRSGESKAVLRDVAAESLARLE